MVQIFPSTAIYSISFCACFIIFGLVGGGLGPVIPMKARIMQVPQTSFSLAFTMKGAGGLFGTVVTSKVQNYMSLNKALSISLLLISYASYVCSETLSLLVFNLMFLIVGFTCMVINVASTSIIIRIFSSNTKIESMIKTLHFSYGIGAFLSPLTTSAVGLASFKIFAGFAVALAVPFFLYKTAQASKSPQHENLLKQNPQSATDIVQHSTQKAEIPSNLNYMIALLMLFYCGCQVNAGGWIATFGIMKPSISMDQALFGASLFWMCFTLGRGLVIPWSQYASTSTQIFVLTTCLFASILFELILILLGKDLVALYSGGMLLGLCTSGIYPLTMNLPNSLGLNTKTENTALFAFGGSIGQMSLPLFVGMQMRQLGPNLLFWNLLILAAATCYTFRKSVQMCEQISQKTDPLQEMQQLTKKSNHV